MKAIMVSSIFTMLFLTGCSTTYYIWDEREEFRDARENLHLSRSTVRLLNGKEISLDSTVLQSSSIAGVTTEGGERQELPLSQVQEISITHVGRGAWRGAKGGLLAGTSIGLMLGAGMSVGGFLEPRTREDAFLLGGAAGALTGLIFGPIAGMAFLSTEYYQSMAPY